MKKMTISFMSRMVREDKSKMTWLGMILQTIWRFSMLAARIVALVLISLTLHKWVFVVIGITFEMFIK